jgi:hypothetical protein
VFHPWLLKTGRAGYASLNNPKMNTSLLIRPSQQWLLMLFTVLGLTSMASAAPPLAVGYAKIDITPKLTPDRPVWLAGYGHGRQATGVHDPIYARCFVLAEGPNAQRKIALVSVDVVGLQYPLVQYVRERLPGIEYTLIASTHNHEAPDVVGIWGETPFKRGVDSEWLREVAGKLVEVVEQAAANLQPATVSYGTADDENLLGDSRQPKVYDGVLRLLRFQSVATDSRAVRNLGLLVQWNCHPEALGSRNTLITADFPYATIGALEEKYDCPTALFSGAVGGLMAPPGNRFRNAEGKLLDDGEYEFAEVYGRLVAKLAEKAVEEATPIELTPFTISAKPIAVPLQNHMYRLAQQLGVLRRKGVVWMGDAETIGSPMTTGREEDGEGAAAVETEVAYLRLGQLHVAGIPGEIYPELVYGKFQQPAEPNVDFPEAPLEKPVIKILPEGRWMLLGLANDEIGYIIPKRQWDQQPPFAYDRRTGQYGEINSCGSEVGPIIMQALERRVKEAGK